MTEPQPHEAAMMECSTCHADRYIVGRKLVCGACCDSRSVPLAKTQAARLRRLFPTRVIIPRR